MKRLKKIILLLVVLEIVHLLVVMIYYYSVYSTEIYVGNEYFEGSERQSASIQKDVASIVKRYDYETIIGEQINKNKLVTTYMLYHKFNSTKSKILESYGVSIYKFNLSEGFHLTQINNKLKVDWYDYDFLTYNMGGGAASLYNVNQKFGIKGDLEISSLEYYYKGDIIGKKDSLNGRLKTILLYPKAFEVGFNNNQKRMIYVESEDRIQPLSISFYKKENMLFLIFFSSEKNEITENSINEFIVFD